MFLSPFDTELGPLETKLEEWRFRLEIDCENRSLILDVRYCTGGPKEGKKRNQWDSTLREMLVHLAYKDSTVLHISSIHADVKYCV